MKRWITRIGLPALAALIALPGVAEAHTETTLEPTPVLNVAAFNAGGLVRAPRTVDCTLENGLETQCAEIVVRHLPDNLEIGPFCPATLADAGGIWNWDGGNPGLYRVDGTFLRMLDSLGYRFYDDDGTVHIADIGVAPPINDHACINVSLDASVEITTLLPLNPVMATTPSRLGVVNKVGLALNGVPIFSDAPSVLHTGHMPALDTCGGHVDPGGWYHWHATATDIETVFAHDHVDAHCNLAQASDAMFGYAFDGFPLYGSADRGGVIPTGLDDCNGHIAATREYPGGIYHYHAATGFPNLPRCLSGVQARNNFTTNARAGIGSPNAGPPPMGGAPGGRGRPGNGGPGRPDGPPPGFAEAAQQLGVSEQALFRAMEAAGGPQADLAAVARTLGVTEAALRAALPPPPDRRR